MIEQTDIERLTQVLQELLIKLDKPTASIPRATHPEFANELFVPQPPEYLAEPKPTEKIPIRELLASSQGISSEAKVCPQCKEILGEMLNEANECNPYCANCQKEFPQL